MAILDSLVSSKWPRVKIYILKVHTSSENILAFSGFLEYLFKMVANENA